MNSPLYLFICVCLTFLLLSTSHIALITAQQSSPSPTSQTVEIKGTQIILNGEPYFIQGVVYSPSSIGSHPEWNWPYGDFYIAQYYDIWERDFALMKHAGINTLRVNPFNGWKNDYDHTLFLDTAHKYGLKVIITFYTGNAYSNPVDQEWKRQGILGSFSWQVQKYIHHPAILAWQFGAELNANWNNFVKAFSDANNCGWNPAPWPQDPNGCYGNPSDACNGPTSCAYTNLFNWINAGAQMVKNAMGDRKSHLIFAGLADVDLVPKRLSQFESSASAVDAWAMQIYRGRNFSVFWRDADGKMQESDFLKEYEQGSKKPLVVSEFGVDAYNDPCGSQTDSPCFNVDAQNPPVGFGEDEVQQAEWVSSLIDALTLHSSADGLGSVAGCTVHEWTDEYWRSSNGVAGCYGPIPFGLPGFDKSQCAWKAHVNCPHLDPWHNHLCGYYTTGTFDNYSNVGWYGIVKPSVGRPGDIDVVTPRLLYRYIKERWAGSPSRIWLYVTAACVMISFFVSIAVYFRWRARMAEYATLKTRSSHFDVAHHTRNLSYGSTSYQGSSHIAATHTSVSTSPHLHANRLGTLVTPEKKAPPKIITSSLVATVSSLEAQPLLVDSQQ